MTQDHNKDLEQHTDSTASSGRVLHRRVTRTVESEEFFSEPQCPPVPAAPTRFSGVDQDGPRDGEREPGGDCGCDDE